MLRLPSMSGRDTFSRRCAWVHLRVAALAGPAGLLGLVYLWMHLQPRWHGTCTLPMRMRFPLLYNPAARRRTRSWAAAAQRRRQLGCWSPRCCPFSGEATWLLLLNAPVALLLLACLRIDGPPPSCPAFCPHLPLQGRCHLWDGRQPQDGSQPAHRLGCRLRRQGGPAATGEWDGQEEGLPGWNPSCTCGSTGLCTCKGGGGPQPALLCPFATQQAARSTEMSDYRLFPCLRATADLLMMPKEVGSWAGVLGTVDGRQLSMPRWLWQLP